MLRDAARTTPTREFTIQYHAILREERGCDSELVRTIVNTPADLYEELKKQHGFSLPFQNVKVAVNGEFQSGDTPLKHGDTVVFIPPVAGG